VLEAELQITYGLGHGSVADFHRASCDVKANFLDVLGFNTMVSHQVQQTVYVAMRVQAAGVFFHPDFSELPFMAKTRRNEGAVNALFAQQGREEANNVRIAR
jgi:hypothetical protein